MRILNPDGSPVENPTIEQQIAALMAGHDTLANAVAAHEDRLVKMESTTHYHAGASELTAAPLPHAGNMVNGRPV